MVQLDVTSRECEVWLSRHSVAQCCQIRNVKVSYQNLKIIVFWEKLSYKNQTHNIYIFYNNFIFQFFLQPI